LHQHAPPQTPYTSADLPNLGSNQLLAYRYREFLKRCSNEFPHVVAIGGNHELYNGRWSAGISHLREEYSRYPNIHFLERDAWTHKDVMFIGGTLWTDMNKSDPVTLHSIHSMLNDYHLILNDEKGYTKLRPAHTVYRHRKTVEFFETMLKDNPGQKTVVVSHHAPCARSISEKYVRDTIMNGAYYSDLSNLILDNPQIPVWFHGHIHSESDYTIGDTRVVCNPRGYVGLERASQEDEPYYPKIVEV
jgi:DNA repair exonuclease SbcCD nuclease subunit